MPVFTALRSSAYVWVCAVCVCEWVSVCCICARVLVAYVCTCACTICECNCYAAHKQMYALSHVTHIHTTPIRTCINSCTHIWTHTHINCCMHMCTHTQPTHVHTYTTNTCTHTQPTRAHIHNQHKCTDTAYTHSHIHTHTYLPLCEAVNTHIILGQSLPSYKLESWRRFFDTHYITLPS